MNTNSAPAADSPNLYVEPGETVLLAPDSQRFGALYKRVYPRSIDEVRGVLGLSDTAARALKAQRNCCESSVPGALCPPEDLTSEDKVVRRRAKEVAVQAAYQYVTGTSPQTLVQWKPLIDRYIEIGKVTINYIVLTDIEIAEGGTLLISASTNALYANNIKIHGSGRIWCQGDISIKCVTLQGIRKFVAPPLSVEQQARLS